MITRVGLIHSRGRIFTLHYIKMFFLLSNPLKNLLNMTIISSCFKKLSIKQKHFVCRKILKLFYTNIYFTTLSRFPVYDSIKLIIALCMLLFRWEMLSMCLLFESNKTICKVNFKLKNFLQIVRLKHIDIFKSFDLICLWFFFEGMIGGVDRDFVEILRRFDHCYPYGDWEVKGHLIYDFT